MKKVALLAIFLVFALVNNSCKKDEPKDYNNLTVTTGDFSGVVHSYSPNSGFWSPATETVRQVHLVLGGTENVVTDYLNKMSILFYYSGQKTIDFPSTDGQWVTFILLVNNIPNSFQAHDAVLKINTLNDNLFEGNLSGDFISSSGSKIMTFSLDIRVDLQQI